ncbi:MAG: hypothetical protein M1830_009289 [Pleopsidium flavum]|nr:MAG: hypothetical protein M1830_009289 [Pleopsidium flavum]
MADMVGGGLGGMTGALQGTATNVLSTGQNYLDRFFPPEKRQDLYAKISKFATEKPMLASFILSQVALTGIPLGLFVVMTIGVLVFALVAALVLGVLGALVFTVICVGFALLILLPVLFITTFAGAFIWLWGVGGYYILKWFNKKDIPGIHSKMGDSMNLEALNGEAKGGEKKDANGTPKKLQDGEKGHANGSAGKPHVGEKSHANGTAGKVPGGDKLGDVRKTTGADLPGAGDVKKKANVGDVKGSVPGGVL